MPRLPLRALALALSCAGPAAALEPPDPGAPAPAPIEPPGSRFVACDNGIRCFQAPCPSRNAYDLDARKRILGVDFDASPLTPEERRRLTEERGLYYGTLALIGHVEERPFTLPEGGAPRSRQVLVISSLIGPAPEGAAALCRGGAPASQD
ncbi:hypothetical protein [Neomegalonema sp.]|uniref:hypothetical protein n=1 Tax=Neomegalonema sp. TaxID=2039713 RepID=UPI00262FFC1F|nr:hypothetical protein [Neomegalonema sp.]MDD2868185.1 hypothetical protein [Neomegalonema sp.]